jgi:hypothetical protein
MKKPQPTDGPEQVNRAVAITAEEIVPSVGAGAETLVERAVHVSTTDICD